MRGALTIRSTRSAQRVRDSRPKLIAVPRAGQWQEALRVLLLARRSAVVCGGGRILRGPLEQHRIVCVHAAGGNEIRLRLHVARVGVGVELAVAARPWLVELRMEREALETAFASLRLDVHAPV